MAWKIEVSPGAERDLEKLDVPQSRRIIKFLFARLATLENPRSIGEALHGSRFGELWKYRVGNYRLISKIEDERVVVLVLQIGHRKEIYR